MNHNKIIKYVNSTPTEFRSPISTDTLFITIIYTIAGSCNEKYVFN